MFSFSCFQELLWESVSCPALNSRAITHPCSGTFNMRILPFVEAPLSLSRFDDVIKATVQQISPGTSNKNPINMGLSFYLFHLFLAVYPHLLEAADCSCNGYITPRGQGECKTTYKVVRSMSESCVDNSAEGSRIKKHLDLWEERKISSTFAGRHLLLCWRGRVQRSVASKVPVSRYY